MPTGDVRYKGFGGGATAVGRATADAQFREREPHRRIVSPIRSSRERPADRVTSLGTESVVLRGGIPTVPARVVPITAVASSPCRLTRRGSAIGSSAAPGELPDVVRATVRTRAPERVSDRLPAGFVEGAPDPWSLAAGERPVGRAVRTVAEVRGRSERYWRLGTIS